jgi:hypothetical protein
VPDKNGDLDIQALRDDQILRALDNPVLLDVGQSYTIPYSNLVNQLSAIRLEAHYTRLFHLLGEISRKPPGAGCRAWSSTIKTGDMQPGPGFFELAQLLGRDTSDILRCWVSELHRVHAIWSRPGAG